MKKDAIISADGKYRYRLSRVWDEALPQCTFIMLNPSTADDKVDDPTITRCIGFARSWGMGGFDVRNLFALRTRFPMDLRFAEDPVGVDNDEELRMLNTGEPRLIVAAWGLHGKYRNRDEAVKALITRDLSALAFTSK